MSNVPAKKKRLGDMLVQEGVITQKQLERAVELQRVKGGRLGDILVELNLATEDLVLSVLAKRAGVPYVSSVAAYGAPPAAVLALISPEMARRQKMLPLSQNGRTLTVALADPFVELNAVDDLKIQTGCDIQVVLAPEREIERALTLYYTNAAVVPAAVLPADAQRDQRMDAIVDALLESASKAGASRVYIEPTASAIHVRYRIKGVLQRRPDLPLQYNVDLIGRVKSLARLDAGESWVPQEGRLQKAWEGKSLDVKVTTLPTTLGETVVFELLDADKAMPLELDKLGIEPEVLDAYRRMAESPKGLVLVAGPTGSGKTSTLYATLSLLNDPSRHVLTVEDPVERFLEGITQMQARPDVRLTLSSGLHILRRQDPDVIMVSDIRDHETAEAAAQAATECLVFGAVNAPDALGAVQQITDFGLPPALLGQVLIGVLAQRLVRTICPHCRESYVMSLRQLMALGVGSQEMRAAKRAESFTLYRGRGCGRCLATGYMGVSAAFEALPINDTLRRLIGEKASVHALARETTERETLREAAVKKALAGDTTVEEALRIGPRHNVF